MNNFINNLFAFIKAPVWGKDANISSIQKLKKILYALLFYFVFVIGAAFLMVPINALLKQYFHVDLLTVHKDTFKEMFRRLGTEKALFFVIIFGPVIEETIFRLWLGLNKYFIAVSVVLITLTLAASFSHHGLLSSHFSIIVVLVSIAAGTLALIFASGKNLTGMRNRYFKYLYYLSVLSFGLIHISNFSPIHYAIFWAYPFFILPQLGLGFISGFIRTKYGFIWGIMLHVLINFLGSVADIVKFFHHF